MTTYNRKTKSQSRKLDRGGPENWTTSGPENWTTKWNKWSRKLDHSFAPNRSRKLDHIL